MWTYVEVPWWQDLKRQWGGQNQRFLVISVTISSEPLELKPMHHHEVPCRFSISIYTVQWAENDWPWMTLRCHFMLKCVFIVVFTRFFCLAFGDNYVKTNEDTPILSATQMFASYCSFWRYKVYADIRYVSCVRRRKLTVGWSKASSFNAISCTVLQTFKN